MTLCDLFALLDCWRTPTPSTLEYRTPLGVWSW